MRRGPGANGGVGRVVGVALVALSMVHAPLPQPDFHNIRHHDGPGEVCEHHDHLLRWHPGAGFARDVAVLHWHWFLPSAPEPGAPAGDGPAIHADVPVWLAGAWDDDGPRLGPEVASRLLEPPAPCPLQLLLDPPRTPVLGAGVSDGAPRPLAFGATFAPGASLAALLHRWVC